MRRIVAHLAALLLTTPAMLWAGQPARPGNAAVIEPASEAWPQVFVWRDTCNVYILREGESAILFNLGDGTVLEHLKEIGVKQVEWILFSDHHREQCQGIARIDRASTRIAAPKEEQALFETPLQFRKWRPTLGDAYTVHGASYVRPPPAAIKVDRLLSDGEVFTWRGHEIRCVSTPGHSPGGMCYGLGGDERACAFIGGVMHDGARLSNWYDSEWDYGFAKGLDALIESVQRLGDMNLSWAFPSEGPSIKNASEQLKEYHRKLVAFRPDYLRGYPVKNLKQRMRPDPHVKPTAIRQIAQVTPHLYKFSDELAGKNFAIIISDNGRGLLLDCGIFPELLLHDLIKEMETHLGLKGIDALWINHMHGDHFTLGSVLKKRYGVKVWTLDRIADKVENPLYYDYCALITSYNQEYEGLKVDRPLRDGEVVDWEGFKLHIDWMPGQTEFGNCLWLELDGKRIAFTGDNLFGDPSDPEQNGHEAVVARNSAIFEEGYLLGSRYLRDLKPDIVMGAHNVLMAEPAAFLDRYHEWSKRIIARYKELLPDPNYEYQFDPFWVSAYPYRLDLQQQRSQEVAITVRNFRDKPQTHEVRLRLPPGVSAEPAVLEGTLAAKSRKSFKVKITADPARVAAGVQLIPFDITLDGKRHGELFDFLMQARPEDPEPHGDAAVRDAVSKSLPFLEKEGVDWMNDRGCMSCHHVPFLLWSHRAAQFHGLSVDARKIAQWDEWTRDDSLSHRNLFRLQTYDLGKVEADKLPEAVKQKLKPLIEQPFKSEAGFVAKLTPLLTEDEMKSYRTIVLKTAERTPYAVDRAGGGLDVLGQLLLGSRETASILAQPEFRDGVIGLMNEIQLADGSWTPGNQFATMRRWSLPTANQATTMWATLALSSYDAPGEKRAASIEKAIAYIRQQAPMPDNREWLATRLLFERKFGSADEVMTLRKSLLDARNADGGWGWEKGVPSDSYTTGLAIYALAKVRSGDDQAVFREARKLLLATQQPDGSWPTPSKNITKSTEPERLKARDEIYHYWGTAWAAIGLLETLGKAGS